MVKNKHCPKANSEKTISSIDSYRHIFHIYPTVALVVVILQQKTELFFIVSEKQIEVVVVFTADQMAV